MDVAQLQGTNPVNVVGQSPTQVPSYYNPTDSEYMDYFDDVDSYIDYVSQYGNVGNLDWQMYDKNGHSTGTLRDLLSRAFMSNKNNEFLGDLNTDDINVWKNYYESLYEKYNALQNDYWKQEMDYNAREAEKSRAWSEYMDSTRVDRNMEQLKRNGINPLLAVDYLLGGSSYGNASASASSPSSTFMNPSSMLNAEITKIGQNKQLVASLIKAVASIFKIFSGKISK